MAKKMKRIQKLDFDLPLQIENHGRPVSRRQFLGRGLIAGGACAIGPSLLGLLGPNAYAAVTEADCGVSVGAATNGKIPFIAVDLSGGANIAGSNVLVGGASGQTQFLSAAGYSKLGLPANRLPSLAGQTDTLDAGGQGLLWHADSAMLRGIRDVASQATLNNVNGAILCARSANDTGDNPHNPMYGIYKAGADGDVVTLIGSRSSESGGRSRAPDSMIDLSVRPTKISSGDDARGLVDTGKLAQVLPNGNDARNVMLAMERISEKKLSKLQEDTVLERLVECGYFESTITASGDAGRTDIDADPLLNSVFSNRGLDIDDFEKTAAVSKLVVNGLAGAGTVQFGGYDYHDSTRTTGDARDRRAGREIGVILEYAGLLGRPVMVYVFSDGSVASDGTVDSTGKGIWKGDNSSTSASLMLVYNPNGIPQIVNNNQQIGYFRDSGSIETAATVISNNVDQLAEAVVLNYMALHGEAGRFAFVLPNHGLGSTASDLDALIAFAPIV
ncbi:MAG: twin-arginine translocation signal domain-containing protein [Gammaproteobacteria bacterium]|nr:twin-arginine translocation signal domain-containing protein [Gammaproteobacteria bacterium]MDH5799717.1 twin-arginine translocation signal domain-containing protein [Gammaproteobacteria bacterium]